MQITELKNRPSAIPVIAGWIQDEWGAFSGRTPTQTLERFRVEVGIETGTLPLTLAAFIDGEPVGCASLRDKDSVDWDPSTTPWICNVYVSEAARGRGVAKHLCNALAREAAHMGFSNLYLAASDKKAGLYQKLGYEIYKTVPHPHDDQNLMQLNIEQLIGAL